MNFIYTICKDTQRLVILIYFLMATLLPFNTLAQGSSVVGGEAVDIEDYPWQVALVQAGNFTARSAQFCGGSIIDQEWILTAAHCLDQFTNANQIEIAYGISSLKESDNTINYIGVEAFYLHPNYNSQTQDNDIALIKLDGPIPLGAKVEVISYATSNHSSLEVDGYNSFVTGWGNRTGQEGASDYPNQLHGAQVPVISNNRANNYYVYNGAITSGMLVAGYLEGGIDACQGDSGGPLAAQDENGNWVQIGVVSWGYGCARANYPGVYARVSHYQDWIESYLLENDNSDDQDSDSTDESCEEVLNNLSDNTEIIVDYPQNGSGYSAGNNSYGDLGVYEQFVLDEEHFLKKISFAVYKAKDGASASNVTIQVLGDENGLPNANDIILQSLVPMSSFAEGYINSFSFDESISVNGTFYVGLRFSYDTGDTLVLYTGNTGQTNTAYTLYSDGSFAAFSDDGAWGRYRALAITTTLTCSDTSNTDDTSNDDTDDNSNTDDTDSTGNDQSDNDDVVTNVSDPAQLDFSFSLYPNPVHQYLNLDISGKLEGANIYIYNILGDLVDQMHLDQNVGIDVSNYQSGLYFMNISNSVHSITKQFSVE